MYVMILSSAAEGVLAQFSPPPNACGTIITGFPSAATLARALCTVPAGAPGIG